MNINNYILLLLKGALNRHYLLSKESLKKYEETLLFTITQALSELMSLSFEILAHHPWTIVLKTRSQISQSTLTSIQIMTEH